ncbi:CPBP family intramembrane glutamic endopeptidase [Marinactinospora rubrisoli]|uniref:CPBP family intramembrane glutamic endopeptidase n=1 Tax=Marinactinospora rubrisoli TaxID=2715399 RepID=A0ABW2KED5_9ACTN
MPWSESIPQFSSTATLLAFVLVGYAAIGEPLLGWPAFAWLRRRRSSVRWALGAFYALTIAIQVTWVVIVAAILLLSPGLHPGDLGLRAPHALLPLLTGAGTAVAVLVAWWLAGGVRRRFGRSRARAPRQEEPAGRQRTAPGAHVMAVLAPRSRRERRLAVAVSVTAGVCEEVLYRGLFIAFGVSLGLPVWAAAVLSCLLFAVAHVYQGWWGLVGPGLLGVLFTLTYLGTGSLIVPILLHLAIDLGGLLFTGSGRRRRVAVA